MNERKGVGVNSRHSAAARLYIGATPATGEPAIVYVGLLLAIWGMYVILGALLIKIYRLR